MGYMIPKMEGVKMARYISLLRGINVGGQRKIKKDGRTGCVAVLLKTPSELQQIIATNPFLEQKGVDISKLYITFLSEAPTESALNRVREIDNESDKFIIANKEIFLYCPHGYGRTKFSNDFFEKKLGVSATTRNWRTVTLLFALAKNQAHSV